MPETIKYFDRYKGTVETEQIYGEKWLHRAYGNPIGRATVQLLVRRAFFSNWYGRKMNKRFSDLKILPFITEYNVDAGEFLKSPFDYKTFNEFFYRALKPEARPIAPGDDVAVFPADGRHLVFPNVDTAEGFYVKGMKFSMAELLGDPALATEFAGGAMVISRLCPTDYHRFHFPAAGTPGEATLINGWLYSVSPIALRRNIQYLVENKRMRTPLETAAFGKVMILEVGATNVGTIRQSFVPGRAVAKGDEKGLFAFGGSCVITLFRKGRITFDQDVVEQSRNFIETYVKMGDHLGKATS